MYTMEFFQEMFKIHVKMVINFKSTPPVFVIIRSSMDTSCPIIPHFLAFGDNGERCFAEQKDYN